jgi:hypothetical protein
MRTLAAWIVMLLVATRTAHAEPDLTFDGSAGYALAYNGANAPYHGPAGTIGAGGWIGQRTSVAFRLGLARLTYRAEVLAQGSASLSFRRWVHPRFWLGGGLGLGDVDYSSSVGDEDVSGLVPTAELAVGFVFPSRLTVSAQLVAPALHAALLVGYQYGSPRTASSAPRAPRSGGTFEISGGIDAFHVTGFGSSPTFEPMSVSSKPGPTVQLAAGGWLTRRLALTGRVVVSVRTAGEQEGTPVVAAYVGPSLQYWMNERLWVGGGAGVSSLELDYQDETKGVGIDLRAGYVVAAAGAHAMNVSIEVNPSVFASDEVPGALTATAFMLLVGYQYL